jgi:predicted Holliday junction resolvase-like endonuclease
MNKILILLSILIILTIVSFSLYFSLNAEIGEVKKRLENMSRTYENEHFVILDNINSLYNEMNKTRSNIDILKNRIDELEYEIRRLNIKVSQKGLTNPSMEELRRFIEEDNTDKLEYKNKTFTCLEFANTFVRNFASKGYFSCATYLIVVV